MPATRKRNRQSGAIDPEICDVRVGSSCEFGAIIILSAALSITDDLLHRNIRLLRAKALNRLRDSLLRGGLGREHYPQGIDRR
jgi:hypothetical protein